MKCYQCGYESEQDFTYCPGCGFAAPNPGPATLSATNPILQALKDKLFLIVCIAMSASCIFAIAADGLPLINILIAVFLWLTYAQAKKDIADAKHLRCVSGAVYAQYVITYVVAGLMALAGIIFAVAFGALASDPVFLSTLLSGFGDFEDGYSSLVGIWGAVGSGVIAAIFVVIAIIIIVINIFSMRYIHRFAKSVYQSIDNSILALQHTKAAKIWLCIVGVVSAINALSYLGDGDISSGLSSIADCLTAILPVLLINKYLNGK